MKMREEIANNLEFSSLNKRSEISKKAMLAFADGYPQKAIDFLEKAKEEEYHCDIFNNLGVLYFHIADYEKAESHFRNACVLSYKYHHYIHYQGARIYLKLAAFYKNQEYIEKAVFLDHEITNSSFHKYNKALKYELDYQLLTIDHSLIPDPIYKEAVRLYQHYSYEKVMEFCKGKQEEKYLYMIAIASAHLGFIEEAESYIRRTKGNFHDYGYILLQAGKLNEARKIFMQDIGVESRYQLALMDGEYDEVIKTYHDYHNHYHLESSYHHSNLGWLFYHMCDFDMAINSFTKAIDLEKNNQKAHQAKMMVQEIKKRII